MSQLDLALIVLIAQFMDPVRWIGIAVVAHVIRSRAAAIASSAAVALACWAISAAFVTGAGANPGLTATAALVGGALLGWPMHAFATWQRRRRTRS